MAIAMWPLLIPICYVLIGGIVGELADRRRR